MKENIIDVDFENLYKMSDISINIAQPQSKSGLMYINTDTSIEGLPRYPIIALCGSTKFKEDIIRVRKELTLKGYIVLSPEVFSHFDNEVLSEDVKELLEEIHKVKIDMASEIYIINKDGYIGESVKNEIEYAKIKNKKITYMEN